jgi:hypothetical protein
VTALVIVSLVVAIATMAAISSDRKLFIWAGCVVLCTCVSLVIRQLAGVGA